MRIIGGTFGGRHLTIPKGLPARPTTDRAKEALFNILRHQIDWEDCDVLDLFSGTGNIAIECASRGARSVVAVERDRKSVAAISQTKSAWGIDALRVIKSDIKRFIRQPSGPYHLIFLDPPYHWDGVGELITTLLTPDWMAEDALLVAEHIHTRDLSMIAGWTETRKYGDSSFSFFQRISNTSETAPSEA